MGIPGRCFRGNERHGAGDSGGSLDPLACRVPKGDIFKTVFLAWLAGGSENRRGHSLLLAGSVHTGLEGILIATASLFLARRLGTVDFLAGLGIKVGTIAGLLLALRWTSDILFAPAIGWLSDRLGQRATLVFLVSILLISLIGVVNVRGPFLVPCLAFLFLSSAGLNVTLSALANGLAMQMERPHIYIGVYATVTDAGSALGPLLAYFAGTLVTFATLYVLAGGALALAVLRYWWVGTKKASVMPTSNL